MKKNVSFLKTNSKGGPKFGGFTANIQIKIMSLNKTF